MAPYIHISVPREKQVPKKRLATFGWSGLCFFQFLNKKGKSQFIVLTIHENGLQFFCLKQVKILFIKITFQVILIQDF